MKCFINRLSAKQVVCIGILFVSVSLLTRHLFSNYEWIHFVRGFCLGLGLTLEVVGFRRIQKEKKDSI